MPPQTLAMVATLLSFAPHENRIELRLDHGSAEMVWLSPSAFRFRRTLGGPLPAAGQQPAPSVVLQIDDETGLVRIRSKFLNVTIQKRGVLVNVRRADGSPLMIDASEPRAAGAGVVWERQMAVGSRFYGLGPQEESGFDLRGKAVASEVPFLISTAGYGEFHATKGAHRFDFTGDSRYRIEAPRIDYYFYYGPTAKQIFEEQKDTRGGAQEWREPAPGQGSWGTLRTMVLHLVHGSMSAMTRAPAALRPYMGAAPELVQRARQLGSLVEDVSPGPVGLSDFRKQLDSFFATYSNEEQAKGFPIWHALPFQFPEDPECARHTDEFMLGDEMLIAPIYEPGNRRTLYLPQGVWTNLETNEVFPGRRTIAVESAGLPVFARNGTIVPLDSATGIALHYFPTLAAEFFLLESDTDEWTQVHAAPAADIMRLEIESKKAREYQWVVHHVDRPSAVGFGEAVFREARSVAAMGDRSWYYDAERRNLQVRVKVAAGEDCIVNLNF